MIEAALLLVMATTGGATPPQMPSDSLYDPQTRADEEASAIDFDNPVEQRGVVRYTVAVDARGRTSNCAVTASSGNPSLDSRTCGLLRFFRFKPALDDAGQPTTGTYSGSVSWNARPIRPKFDFYKLFEANRPPKIKAAPGWVFDGDGISPGKGWGNFYYTVDVDAHGRPSNCKPMLFDFEHFAQDTPAAVSERAYHATLDERNSAGCALILKQTFAPKRDHSGQGVPATYTSARAMVADLQTRREKDEWDKRMKAMRH